MKTVSISSMKVQLFCLFTLAMMTSFSSTDASECLAPSVWQASSYTLACPETYFLSLEIEGVMWTRFGEGSVVSVDGCMEKCNVPTYQDHYHCVAFFVNSRDRCMTLRAASPDAPQPLDEMYFNETYVCAYPSLTSSGVYRPSNYECVGAGCATGEYEDNSGTCTPCPAGTYESDGACVACLRANNEYQPNPGQQECWTCPAGMTPEAETNAVYCHCQVGYTLVDNSCVSCMDFSDSLYKDYEGNGTCSTCPGTGSMATYPATSINDCICVPGYYPMNTEVPYECTQCDAGLYKSYYGAGTCTSCAAYTTTVTPGAFSADQCVAVAGAFYNSETAAFQPCPFNTYKSTVGNTECTPCFEFSSTTQEFATDISYCMCMTAGMIQAADAYRCDCALGYYSLGQSCESCGAGYVCAGGNVDLNAANAAVRSACNPGYVLTSWSGPHAVCTECAPNFYCNGTSQLACPDGLSSVAGSGDASACACGVGEEPQGAGCVTCVEGKYKASVGNSACVACEGNTSTASVGAVAASACMCAAGYEPEQEEQTAAPTANMRRRLLTHASCPAPGGPPPPYYCVAGWEDNCLDETEWVAFFTSIGMGDNYPPFAQHDNNPADGCMSCVEWSIFNTEANCATIFDDVVGSAVVDESVQCVPCAAGKYKSLVNNSQCDTCPEGAGSDVAATACVCLPGYSISQEVTMPRCGDRYAGYAQIAIFEGYEDQPQVYRPAYDSAHGFVQNVDWILVNVRTDLISPYGDFEHSEMHNRCKAACDADAQCRMWVMRSWNYECHLVYRDLPLASYANDIFWPTLSGWYSVYGCSTNLFARTCGGTFKKCTVIDYTVCHPCATSTYKAEHGTAACSPCPANSSTTQTARASVGECVCDVGFYGTASEGCVVCPEGYFCAGLSSPSADVISTVEQLCPEGRTSAAGAQSADDCVCAWPLLREVAGVCSGCPADTFADAASQTCAACPANTRAPNASAYPVNCTCLPGWEGPAGGPCVELLPCPPGSTGPDSVDPASCVLCDAGTFKDGIGSAECTPCQANSSSPQGATQCQCLPGFELDVQTDTCAECAEDTYGSNEVCIACPTNMDSPAGSANESDCACVAEGYGVVSGACVQCEANTYSSAGSCVPCEANAESAAGSAACVCSAGFERVGDACQACAGDTIKASAGDESCTACPALTSVYAQPAVECLCDAGGYVNDAGNCVSCTSNSVSEVNSAGTDSCLCVAGFFKNASDHCERCPADTYKDATGNEACSACPENSESPRGSTAISACTCSAGYVGFDGYACQKECPAGSQRKADDSGCEYCGNSFYKPDYGNAACTACPANSNHQLVNQTSVEACTCEWGHVRHAEWPAPAECMACLSGTAGMTCTSILWCQDVAATDGACPDHYCLRGGGVSCTPVAVNVNSNAEEKDSAGYCIGTPLCDRHLDRQDPWLGRSNWRPYMSPGVEANMVWEKLYAVPTPYLNPGHPWGSQDPPNPHPWGGVGELVEIYSGVSYSQGCVERCEENPNCTWAFPRGSDDKNCWGRSQCNYGCMHWIGDGDINNLPLKYTYYVTAWHRKVEECAYALTTFNNFAGDRVCYPCHGVSDGQSCSDIQSVPAGMQIDSTGVNLELCPVNTWKDESGLYCQPCPEYSLAAGTGSASVDACVCSAGFVFTGQECTACGAGFYETSGVCVQCPPAHSSAAGSTSSDDCLCAAGFGGADGAEACEECAVGTYKALVSNSGCVACPGNTTTLSNASTSASQCVCRAGFEFVNGFCFACPANKFKQVPGSHDCTPCPEHTLAPQGATTAAACECPEHDEHIMLVDGVCVEACAAGFFLQGQHCTPCLAGTYKNSKGFGACQPCPPYVPLSAPGSKHVNNCSCAESLLTVQTDAFVLADFAGFNRNLNTTLAFGSASTHEIAENVVVTEVFIEASTDAEVLILAHRYGASVTVFRCMRGTCTGSARALVTLAHVTLSVHAQHASIRLHLAQGRQLLSLTRADSGGVLTAYNTSALHTYAADQQQYVRDHLESIETLAVTAQLGRRAILFRHPSATQTVICDGCSSQSMCLACQNGLSLRCWA